jgi:hypothetical protein
MLTLTGEVINVFKQPKGEKDGKEFGGQDKIQLIGKVSLPNGTERVDMFTLTSHNIDDFKEFTGQQISIPVGVMASGRTIIYFIPKGSKPSLAA